MYDPEVHRPSGPSGIRTTLTAALLIGVALTYGCVATGAGGRVSPSLTPSPQGSVAPSSSAYPSPPPTPDPSVRPSPDPSPSGVPVDTVTRAVALVLASDPRFAGIGPRQIGLIGQPAWYEASQTANGFVVTIRIGWGDCPSGCIEEHRWRYAVARDGRIDLREESGDHVPGGVRPPAVEGDGQLHIKLVAGPTCPVETVPPRPGCEPAKVAAAMVIVRDADGRIVAEPTSDDEGLIGLTLSAGVYVLEPSAVDGYMGQAEPAIVWVLPGPPSSVTLAYDTGIR